MRIPAKLIRYVSNQIQYIRRVMYLCEWSIHVAYQEEPHAESNVQADITVDTQYLTATINLYLVVYELWKKKSPKVFEILVHEMCHILTDPLYYVAEKGVTKPEMAWLEELREQTTERMSQIIVGQIPLKNYKID